MNLKFINFLELWQNLKVEEMSDKQLEVFRKILLNGLHETQREMNKRDNIKERMTIQERAKEYVETEGDGTSWDWNMEQDYIKGAKDQQKIDIEKACRWLEDSIYPTIKTNFDNIVSVESTETFLDKFRKAMEEQIA